MNRGFKMDNLRKLRESKNITQTRLSVEIEISQEIISHYEIGGSRPNVENLIKIADYFNCSTDYLLNRTTNPKINKALKNDETTELLYKYDSLSKEDKQHLSCFLDYLYKKQK